MRILIGLAAVLLGLSLVTPSKACEDYASTAVLAVQDDGQAAYAQATGTDAAKKPEKKKVAMKKKPKEKVQYMRIAP